jgi:putative ABC transport system permease protein
MLGLVTFSAQRRTREIGVRKVLGASVTSVVGLLSREFVQLALLANLTVWPIAYWVMSRWLQEFAYHTEIGVGVFAASAAVSLLVVFVTVSSQAP